MCGFVGFIQRAPSPETLTSMLRRIERRGPDGEGRWTAACGEWFVALGHRRLAILDVSGGAQPMSTPDGRTHLAYSGEIYNFRELRRGLEREGVGFRTRSDTEVLLRHSERRWAAGLPGLDGMFAFALWDHGGGRLLLARDRVGMKPVYYAALPDGGLVFGSELTAVLAHPRLGRKISREGLASFLFSDYAHAPTTLVEGVHKLAPGHYLEWIRGATAQPAPFWTRPRSEPARPDRAVAIAAQDLWSVLGRAVERHLVSDVPVGVLLSGGIDSSAIAVLASERSRRELETFSVAFDDPAFDESAYARQLAAQIGSVHTEERLDDRGLLEIIDPALACLDEPLADPSYLPTFLLSRLAASRVKVVLGGDGGDELFGGYVTYRAHRYARLLAFVPGRLRRGWLARWTSGLAARDGYQSLEWKWKRFVLRWDDDARRRHLRWMSCLDLDDLGRAMRSGGAPLPETLRIAPHEDDDPLSAVMALDFSTYLPGSVLTKVDRASMAHGLEVRPPMLDNEVVDWALRAPSSWKVRGRRSKHVLKLAARDHLPSRIVSRPKKGFAVPLSRWLRGPLRPRLERVLAASPLWEGGLLDRRAFAEWALEHDARRGDRSKALWALIVLDEWARRERIEAGPGDAGSQNLEVLAR
jgi:asparagine synthase (glutamine-hydrolysing)